jgi:hypothetical protein
MTAPEAPKAQIIDLLEALKRSVAAAEAGPANSEVEPPSVSKGPKKAERRDESAVAVTAEAPAAATATKGRRKKSG